MDSQSFVPNKDYLAKIINNEKNNPLFKKAATILESVNQALEQKNNINLNSGSAYDTALFASLLSTIKTYLQKEDYEKMDALLLLFHIAVMKVSPAVKQRCSKDIQQVVSKIKTGAPKGSIDVKYIISIYQSLLQVKTIEEWKEEKTQEMFNFILDNVINEKIKIRKKASKALSALCQHGLFKIHKMDFTLQQYCLDIIKCGHINPKPAIYLLYFLNNSLKYFPIRVASEIGHNLVSLLKTEEINIDLATHIYSTIENLLASRPLNGDLVEKFLVDFLTNPPDLVETSNINFAYIQCIAQTLIHLNTQNPKAAKNYISTCISGCNDFLLVNNTKLAALASKTIELIIATTVDPSLWINLSNNNDNLDEIFNIENLELESSSGPTPFQKIISSLKYLTTNQFETAQGYVSAILTTFFDKVDSTCADQCFPLIKEWIDVKNERIPQFWEPVVGKFIQKVSLEHILQNYPVRPLDFSLSDPDYEIKSNSWLLPVLRKYLKLHSLQLFLDYFFPQAAALDDTIYSKPKDEWTDIERQLEIMYDQIWAIFPRFCKFTNENLSNIQKIFEITAQIIANRDDIRKYACQGLEILSGYFLKLPKYRNQEYMQAQQDLEKYSTELMPKLCSLYMAQKPGYKNIINLIRSLSALCRKEYLDKIYLTHIKKLIEEKVQNKYKEHVVANMKKCDILIAMSSSIDIATTYDITKQFIKVFLPEKFGYQKKAFKLLLSISHRVHPSYLTEIYELMSDIPLVNTNSKSAKFDCFFNILEKIEYTPDNIEEVLKMVQKMLPELLVALKEASQKARKSACEILKFLTNKLGEFDLLPIYISYVAAGFAAKTSLMKSAAIMAMAEILKEGKAKLNPEFVWETTTIVLLLIKEKNREVFRAVLQYVKAFMKVVPKEFLQEHLYDILVPLFEWDEDGRNHSKSLLRHFIEKLIRKLGRAIVEETIPGDHKKLVRYLSKQEKLAKKKKQDKKDEKRRPFLEDMLEDVPNVFAKRAEMVPEMERQMEPENDNNLLLKFDTLREKFHFVEHPIAKMKEKPKIQTFGEEKDVIFNEQNGKIVVQDDEITGKKRKREDKYGAEMMIEEESNKPENANAPRRIKKIIKLNEERVVAKKDKEEEKKEAPVENAPKINKKVIADIKLLHTDTLNPTAYIPINPKMLNKRNRGTAAKAFEFLISKKKTGSLAGLKSKMKS